MATECVRFLALIWCHAGAAELLVTRLPRLEGGA